MAAKKWPAPRHCLGQQHPKWQKLKTGSFQGKGKLSTHNLNYLFQLWRGGVNPWKMIAIYISTIYNKLTNEFLIFDNYSLNTVSRKKMWLAFSDPWKGFKVSEYLWILMQVVEHTSYSKITPWPSNHYRTWIPNFHQHILF